MDLEYQELDIGKNPALIMCFTSPERVLGADCPAVLATNQRWLAAFRVRRLSVFFTTVVYHFVNRRVNGKNRCGCQIGTWDITLSN